MDGIRESELMPKAGVRTGGRSHGGRARGDAVHAFIDNEVEAKAT